MIAAFATVGPHGWGPLLLSAALMTLAVSVAAFLAGLCFGAVGAWAKLSASRPARAAAEAYTTILRGIPDLLVIYLFYFGGSQILTAIGHALGGSGFFGLPAFLVGTLAVGLVSGAYQTETLRGAYRAIPPGQIEAARVVGMGRLLMLRRIILPQVLITALPGLGNIWQQVIKESALISVTGLVELLRQVNVGAGSTRQPFVFYIAGTVLYLVLTTLSGLVFRGAERRSARGLRRP
ncbi:MAG: ABC transporter permease subunit [Acetobacteraceae bacterium]